jgi:hypothetical protein
MDILVEAKREYMNQLCSFICPLMIETFQEMYVQACQESQGRGVLKVFQKLLRDVKVWNNNIILDHNSKLINKCSWFNDLLAAVFVSNVKILSSVRLKTESRKISLKLPSNETFLHACYREAARNIHGDPYIFHEESNEFERDEILCNRFKIAIDEAIRGLIPIQDIVKAYICQSDVNEAFNTDAEEPVEPDIETEEPEEPEEAEEAVDPEEPGEPNDPVEEEKIIPVTAPAPAPAPEPVPEPAPAPEDDVLFGSAPEMAKRKPIL